MANNNEALNESQEINTQNFKINLKEINFVALFGKKQKQLTLNEELASKEVAMVLSPMEDVLANSEPKVKEDLIRLLDSAYVSLKKGEFAEAREFFQEAVFVDLDSDSTSDMLKCVDFWVDRKLRIDFLEEHEKVQYLIEQWRIFEEEIIISLESDINRVVLLIKNWVFTELSAMLLKMILVYGDNLTLYVQLARAYKAQGDFDRAIDAYVNALKLKKDDALVLAELADCYAIIDEEHKAKLLFREAFYQSPEEVDFDYLESAMVVNLKKKVASLVENEALVPYYLPVWGVVLGVFNLAREIRAIEYTKLNQSIYMLRLDLEEKGDRRKELKPQLIYKLFWLIDYHKNLKGDQKLSEETIKQALLEISFLDERVYREYKV